jgi:hypothetical protein
MLKLNVLEHCWVNKNKIKQTEFSVLSFFSFCTNNKMSSSQKTKVSKRERECMSIEAKRLYRYKLIGMPMSLIIGMLHYPVTRYLINTKNKNKTKRSNVD